MFANFATALLLTAQAATLSAAPEAATTAQPAPAIEQKEVAFQALTEGRTDQAITVLRAQLKADPSDPAALINLGSAYAQRGDRERAAQAYRAAAASDTRYNVELADGTWVDSRHAARAALLRLDRAQTALLD
ncbi:MAG: hypothetical protein RLZZ08_240 [Pseudomonadota bacterium]